MTVNGLWRAPELAITNLTVELGGGRLGVDGFLNVETRELRFTNTSQFDIRVLDPMLAKTTGKQSSDYFQTPPPSFQLGGSLLFARWTNAQPDWNHEIRPTVQMAGALAFTNGRIMRAQIDSFATLFSYSNLCWRIPDLNVSQGNTRLEISGSEDDRTGTFQGRIRGAIDPETARPFLTDSNAAHGLDLVKLAEPLWWMLT
ncbi:MAG: hypothetical protein WDN00_04565 [Limisphaerales bacterium]